MIIAITGLKKSGKDTCANYIQANYLASNKKFAYPIKRVAGMLFGWSMEGMEDPIFKEQIDPKWGISPRQFMQNFGTDYMQLFLSECFPEYKKATGRLFFVKYLYEDFVDLSCKNPNHSIVVSDMRFHHELSYLKHQCKVDGYPFYSIRVNRKGLDNDDSHFSEIEIQDLNVDEELDNGRDIWHLVGKLKTIVDGLSIEKVRS